MTVFFLALRNVLLQRRRYLLMFVAIVIGFTLVILVHSITYGALETVKTKAGRYFSGHISLTRYVHYIPHIDNPEEVIRKLEDSGLPIRTISPRTVHYRSDSKLLFNGESVRQRRLIGLDFNKEYDELSQMEFSEGSIDKMMEEDETMGILISEVAAEMLGVRVGDNMSLSLLTQTGQFNSATLIVKGIFRETSIFGYVAYINQKDLNSLLLKDAENATDIAVYFKRGTDEDTLLLNIRELLSEFDTLLPPMNSKTDLNRELKAMEDPTIPVWAPLTLEAHLDQITVIINAVKIVTWFIQLLFMLIIMVGILNTYRVLVYERTKEIGTLRAMGMTREEIRSMFLFEAFFLDLIASISGLVLFSVIIKILGLINIRELPGVGLFTEKGHLIPHMNISAIALTFIMMMAAVLIAAWGPAKRASCLSPVDAMREEN